MSGVDDKVGLKRKPDLQVSYTDNRGTAVVSLQGPLIAGEVAHFRAACREGREQGHKYFVVDLADVVEVDGYGLAALVGLLSRCHSDQGELILCGLNPDLRHRFEATYCDEIFQTATTVPKAIEKMEEWVKS